MLLSALSDKVVHQKLTSNGLRLAVPPFTVSITSHLPIVQNGLRTLYADYEVCSDTDFIDFYMNLDTPGGLRRWIRPQVDFSFDGFNPFMPLPKDQAYALFEWSLNWCVANHMHNYLIIHSGVVAKNGKGVILPAPPGSGKS
ncbi:MAG: HprK-related kinase A, partial [Gammaproteobacteria bacterium]|nr:HprK-related kinase A [Gammaproteobacteria bacterium]